MVEVCGGVLRVQPVKHAHHTPSTLKPEEPLSLIGRGWIYQLKYLHNVNLFSNPPLQRS